MKNDSQNNHTKDASLYSTKPKTFVSDDPSLLEETLSLEETLVSEETLVLEENLEQVSESLMRQVLGEMKAEQEEKAVTTSRKKKFDPYKLMRRVGIMLILLGTSVGILVGTEGGRSLIYKLASMYIFHAADKDTTVVVDQPLVPSSNNEGKDNGKEQEPNIAIPDKNTIVAEASALKLREEDYVLNYLIFGIETIDNARNTDTIMIASINTQDKTIKLTSVLRDTYIEIDGYKPNKLNWFYSQGGVDLLTSIIEEKYLIKIEGYASVDFSNFENIVDLLGGISIQLGKEEAAYLNRTNYISNKKYRTMEAGWNNLNGNQALGYCRVRDVVTLGGYHDDYGRIVRQQRVLNALFNKYKSKNILSMLSIMDTCIGYVKTNVSVNQIEAGIKSVVENQITTIENFRLPANGLFTDPVEYNGIGYPLLLDWEANIVELYQFLYNDTKEEAQAHYDELTSH